MEKVIVIDKTYESKYSFSLDSKADYGFTDLGISTTKKLPYWDLFRLNSIMEIYSKSNKIIDFGGASRGLINLGKSISATGKYFTCDINPNYKPDIVSDICNLDQIDDNAFDGVICAAVLEHVYNPIKAIEELKRIYKPGGQMFIYIPWMFNYHGNSKKSYNPISGEGKEYSDYFRFSKDSIFYWFKEFNEIQICPVRGRFETIGNLTKIFGKRGLIGKRSYYKKIIRKIDRNDLAITSGYQILIK